MKIKKPPYYGSSLKYYQSFVTPSSKHSKEISLCLNMKNISFTLFQIRYKIKDQYMSVFVVFLRNFFLSISNWPSYLRQYISAVVLDNESPSTCRRCDLSYLIETQFFILTVIFRLIFCVEHIFPPPQYFFL